MSLPFSETTFIKVISGDLFNDCVLKDGEFSYALFSNLISKEKDPETKEVLCTISNFCSMYMKEHKTEPFGPMFTFCNGRSFLPEDTSQELAELLYKNIDKITNPAIKARICDSLWIIKKLPNKDNIECAKKAVSCYYNLIDDFISKKQLHAATRYLDRVYNMVMGMPGTTERNTIFDTLTKYADIDYESNLESGSLYWHNILDKISDFTIKDKDTALKYYNKTLSIIRALLGQDFYIFPDNVFYKSKQMQKIIKNPPQDPNFIWIKKFYDVAIKFADKIDKSQKHNLMVSKAKTLEYEAQLRPQMNVFSHLLKEAIYIYRTLPNHKKDIDRLTKAIEHDTTAMPYATFSHTTDVTDLVKIAQDKIAGKSFQEAIFSLVFLFNDFFASGLDKKKARETAQHLQELSPLSFIMTQEVVDEHGHVVTSASTDEELLELNMLRNLWIRNKISYVPIMEAINIINMEHHYQYTDILNLMRDTPMVPNRHKIIIAKGIYSFLKDDMIEAAHFLILQFEDCLRYLLEPTVSTTKLVNNYEEEKNTAIKTLLDKCVENGILPEGLAWFFYSYLVVKNKNLRNSISHGFMPDRDYYSQEVRITCYGIMYLVFFHVALAYFNEQK